MEMMTRRSFLKITGAMALAVGAAGALSGCDAVDNAVGSFFQQYGDQKGHAADSAGSFMYALSNQVPAVVVWGRAGAAGCRIPSQESDQ